MSLHSIHSDLVCALMEMGYIYLLEEDGVWVGEVKICLFNIERDSEYLIEWDVAVVHMMVVYKIHVCTMSIFYF